MTITLKSTATDRHEEICGALNQALAETAVTTMLAQNFHWNVTGADFSQLHQLFQEVYEDHFEAQDELAERVKALDGQADGHFGRMLERSTIEESRDEASGADMLKALLRAEERLASTLKASGELAARHGDTLTEDVCIARGQAHEKFAWMLRSHLR